MKKHNLFRFIIIGVLLVIVSLIVVSCSSSTETSATPTKAPAAATEAPAVAPEPTSPPEPELEGSAIRGGQLYDKWWAVSAGGEDAEHSHEDHEHAGGAPESDHP
ncbi:MAG: hypothetical protein ACE5FD_14120, partial [Anaerolineae bacterium]